jgi:hypothetical protein
MSQFWLNDPSILFKPSRIMNLLPQNTDSWEEKLNSVTRMVLFLTFVSFIYTKSIRIIVACILTLLAIVVIYKNKKKSIKEGLDVKQTYPSQILTQPTKNNPLMNVLITDVESNPTRPPAEPAFAPKVEAEINENAVDPRIFKDLGDNIDFETSMRSFYATANTQIPNDQGAFAQFCYGDMPSCKGGDMQQCIKNNTGNRKVIY